jgi:hypothetical protein
VKKYRKGMYLNFLMLFTLLILGVSSADGEEFQLPPYPDIIQIPISIGGKPHDFILNSGTSTVFMHTTLRPELGKAVSEHRVKGIDARGSAVQFYESPEMMVANEEWTCPDDIGCVDLSLMRAASGRRIEGLLGVPFFRSRIIQFDFDAGVVRTITDSSPKPEWGTPIPITLSPTGLPMIDLQLTESQVETCIVDTGYTGTISLNWQVFQELQKDGTIVDEQTRTFISVNGMKSNRYGLISNVSIGEFKHEQLLVDATESSSRIGLAFLRRYRVTFSMDSATLYLAKGKTFGELATGRSIGFGVMQDGTRYVVPTVQSESPGEIAGIQPGDQLLQIAGNGIEGKSTAEIGWLIYSHAKNNDYRVPLTFQRAGAQRQVVLDVRPVFEDASSPINPD